MPGDSADEESCVRLFISVDLVGSTAFKDRQEEAVKKARLEADASAKRQGGAEPKMAGPKALPVPLRSAWSTTFTEFYSGFPQIFAQSVRGVSLPEKIRPKLVKPIGDELLLQTAVCSGAEALQVVEFLAKAMPEYSRKNLPEGSLLLKGTAWIAGFPINNRMVRLESGGSDYIGPSIDTGFRISKLASPSKLVLSVDLALVLLSQELHPALYFDGAETFKGVLGGRPYPIIWRMVDGPDKGLIEAEIRVRKSRPEPADLLKYCESYIESCNGSWLIRPYFSDDEKFKDPPEWHRLVMEEAKKVDELHAADDPEEEALRALSAGIAAGEAAAAALRLAKDPARKTKRRLSIKELFADPVAVGDKQPVVAVPGSALFEELRDVEDPGWSCEGCGARMPSGFHDVGATCSHCGQPR